MRRFKSLSLVALCVSPIGFVAYAVPQPDAANLQGRPHRGAETEPGSDNVAEILVHDDATRARAGCQEAGFARGAARWTTTTGGNS